MHFYRKQADNPFNKVTLFTVKYLIQFHGKLRPLAGALHERFSVDSI